MSKGHNLEIAKVQFILTGWYIDCSKTNTIPINKQKLQHLVEAHNNQMALKILQSTTITSKILPL